MVKEWVRDLVILVIFVSVIEMLLPGGALKKYVKIVLGFFILLTVLNPILHLLKADFQIGYPFNNLPGHSDAQQATEARGEVMKRTNTALALGAYQSQLAQQIRGIILTQEEVEDAWVRVKATDGGQIEQVEIGLTPLKASASSQTSGRANGSKNLSKDADNTDSTGSVRTDSASVAKDRVSVGESNNLPTGNTADTGNGKRNSVQRDQSSSSLTDETGGVQVEQSGSVKPVEEVRKVEVVIGNERPAPTAKTETDSSVMQRLQAKVVKLITGFYNIKAEAISFK